MKEIKVKSLAHLKRLSSNKAGEFRVLLNGILFSKKIIEYQHDTKLFLIMNSIDCSEQSLTAKQIMDTNETLIGKAMSKGALIYAGKN